VVGQQRSQGSFRTFAGNTSHLMLESCEIVMMKSSLLAQGHGDFGKQQAYCTLFWGGVKAS